MGSWRRIGLTSLLTFAAVTLHAADLIDFWNTPQRGGNSFNRLPPAAAYFRALRDYGATWVRLSYDKWPAAQRDFLLGSADAYAGLQARDLETLKVALDRAHQAGLKVVLVPLSLPGARWTQNNGNEFDDRLWSDRQFQEQSQRFWRDLAAVLRDHPAIAAYNLINEPVPEKTTALPEHASAADMQQWYATIRGTTRDLPQFYAGLIAAIRSVDPHTPIMVDAGWYAAADAFAYWPRAFADERVLYSFHMYEPYAATSAPNLKRAQPYSYPGTVPFADQSTWWDAQRVAAYLEQPLDWASQHHIDANRMVAGEFGCMRRLPHCPRYLEDVLTVLEREHVHWAFYSFREDAWDGMDYELGTRKVPWAFWQAIDNGEPDPLIRKPGAATFEPIRKRLLLNR